MTKPVITPNLGTLSQFRAPSMTATIMVCTHYRYAINQPSCGKRGGEALLLSLREAATGTDVAVEASCCFGRCTEGAVVRIAPGGTFYHGVIVDDAPNIVRAAKLFAAAIDVVE